ncbi:CoA transferase [Phenylobacterium sp. LH3H17]|uniref:CoA transferase n=1 Tax=Phenylobacterium sp. LH3H17 TaxID=2903901 RepID=UPI0020C9A4A5|nr:CoA transferase [Phenylobacterium sp. LH3H17]UTP37853.1 CoA transferase [Phenylobacterium sp. LH3H17]
MYDLLKGLRVVEGSAFVAGPTCGLYLAQLGAEVIRFDNIGGGPDFRRWPLTPGGDSLYWEGLNKSKKSIAIDLSRPEGRELAARLAAAPGEQGGVFVTNFPVEGFLSYEKLAALRPDLICARVMGWADGGPAVDYTINSAVGVPLMTGHPDDPRPVNHVLPAWDLLTGAYAAFALVAAVSARARDGKGREIRIPLSDIAGSTMANLGYLAESLAGPDRPRMGNDLYGAFGRDFVLRDGRRIMLVAITARQWKGLLQVLEIEALVAALESELALSFAVDEGLRFNHRARLLPIFEAAFARKTLAELLPAFEREGVCWGPYQPMSEAARDERLFKGNPVYSDIVHPSGRTYPAAGFAGTIPQERRAPARPASRLGQHTDEVLSEVLGLTSGEIARLHDTGVVAGPEGT